MPTLLFRDIETRSTLDLSGVGVRRYAAEPTTDVWCVSYAVDDAPAKIWIPGQPVPKEFHLAARDPDWLVVAHNDQFERTVEELVLMPRYGWLLAPIERHRCTMAMALTSALPAKLETVAEVLKLATQKDTAAARPMRQMARPRKPRAGENPNGVYWHGDPEKFERLYAYCRRDVDVGRELFHRLAPLIDSEQALWQLDAVINVLPMARCSRLRPRSPLPMGKPFRPNSPTSPPVKSLPPIKFRRYWLGWPRAAAK
jgi:DNA polymerase bacteriophage-type